MGKHWSDVRSYWRTIRGGWDGLPAHPGVPDIHKELVDREGVVIPGLGVGTVLLEGEKLPETLNCKIN